MFEGFFHGLSIGIGIVTGLVLIILLLALAYWGMQRLQQDRFSPELFERYLQQCLEEEDYEEAQNAREILAELEAGRKHPLLREYEIVAEPYLILKSQAGGNETIRFSEERRVQRKG